MVDEGTKCSQMVGDLKWCQNEAVLVIRNIPSRYCSRFCKEHLKRADKELKDIIERFGEPKPSVVGSL